MLVVLSGILTPAILLVDDVEFDNLVDCDTVDDVVADDDADVVIVPVFAKLLALPAAADVPVAAVDVFAIAVANALLPLNDERGNAGYDPLLAGYELPNGD